MQATVRMRSTQSCLATDSAARLLHTLPSHRLSNPPDLLSRNRSGCACFGAEDCAYYDRRDDYDGRGDHAYDRLLRPVLWRLEPVCSLSYEGGGPCGSLCSAKPLLFWNGMMGDVADDGCKPQYESRRQEAQQQQRDLTARKSRAHTEDLPLHAGEPVNISHHCTYTRPGGCPAIA